MLYLDTSIVVSALTNEARSSEVYAWLGQISAPLFVSGWVQAELSAALSVKIRMRVITAAENRAAREAFQELVQTSFGDVPILASDFGRASRLAEKHELGLRGGDALHLAITERHGATLCTLDKAQAEAGRALKIETQLI